MLNNIVFCNKINWCIVVFVLLFSGLYLFENIKSYNNCLYNQLLCWQWLLTKTLIMGHKWFSQFFNPMTIAGNVKNKRLYPITDKDKNFFKVVWMFGTRNPKTICDIKTNYEQFTATFLIYWCWQVSIIQWSFINTESIFTYFFLVQYTH